MKQVRVIMVATGALIYKGILDDESEYFHGYDATIPKTLFSLQRSYLPENVFRFVEANSLEDNVLNLLESYKDLKEELQVLTEDKLKLEENTLSKGSTSYAVILNLIAENKENIDEIQVEFSKYVKEWWETRKEILDALTEDIDLELTVSKAEGTITIYGSMLAVTQRVKRMYRESCRTEFWEHSVMLDGDYEQVEAYIKLYRYLDSEFTMDDAKALNSNYKLLKNILER
jgi:hypothetical protein